jgi:hypothetical protein
MDVVEANGDGVDEGGEAMDVEEAREEEGGGLRS